MKIELMCSKHDIVKNLKKAASLSKIDYLGKLAEYIQQEMELENLKDRVCVEHYEVRHNKTGYQVLKLKSRFNSEKNMWQVEEEEVIKNILLDEVDKIC